MSLDISRTAELLQELLSTIRPPLDDLAAGALQRRQPAAASWWRDTFGDSWCEQALETGLLSSTTEGDYRCAVLLTPVPQWDPTTPGTSPTGWVLSDPSTDTKDHDAAIATDHVMGVGRATMLLLSMLTHLPEPQRVLDLGCGSGVLAQAIAQRWPHCRVTGTDIAPRALAYAELTRGTSTTAANPERLDYREGSWYAPVAEDAGTFDLIVSNPPFVISPPDGRRVYRSGTEHLDGASAEVVRGAVDMLAPGGTLACLLSWIVPDADSDRLAELAEERLRSWLPDQGVAAVLIVRDQVPAADYAATYLADEGIDLASDSGRAQRAEWERYLRDNGAQAIGAGMLCLRRIAPEEPTQVFAEAHHYAPHAHTDLRSPGEGSIASDIPLMLERTLWILNGSLPDEPASTTPSPAPELRDRLLSTTYALNPSLLLETSARQLSTDGPAPFVPQHHTISRLDGPGWWLEVDELGIALFQGLAPEGLSAGDVLDLALLSRGVEEDGPEADALFGTLIDAIRYGAVLPVDLAKHPRHRFSPGAAQ